METATRVAEYITIRDCATMLSVSKGTVFKLLRTGKLPRYKIGKSARIRLSDIAEMMDQSVKK